MVPAVLGPDYRRAFGEALAALREERGFSQEQLAFECDTHRTTISLWERGRHLPSFPKLLTISSVLGVEPSELLRRTEQQIAGNRRGAGKRKGPGRPRKQR